MIDYSNVDTQALLDIVRCAENRPDERFNMSFWYCGTTACLIGSWAADSLNARDEEWWAPDDDGPCFDLLSTRLGLPISILGFLFSEHRPFSRDASDLTKSEAIRRLCKTIYYILHKREILGDYEQARRTGDVGVAQQITKEMEAMVGRWDMEGVRCATFGRDPQQNPYR